ncbi:asparagine synthase (glutamine-hydrolyzing) [Alphaproteobacteria bacterium]|nr:asparagine synthase (glutamine-hydrolyzing) [Alphaproteobacteria bacterium]
MCGIVGLLKLNGINTNGQAPTKRFHAALTTLNNRGPDAEGCWHDENIWLGHRRLSIVDPTSRGNQPMSYSRYVITFNGMIYNYRDLRQSLLNKGYKFHTDTDTEVLLAGWAEWQENLLPRLHGMFAFAIWDKVAKSLILVRDRFGKKPIYYRNWRGAFAFGSRFDAIETLTETAQLSHDALTWLLTLKYIPDPFSASDEIQKLPAGHILEIAGEKQVMTKWYQAQPDAAAIPLSASSQRQKLKSLLDQAVAERLVSDVPIACFLSGGIDSAIIASLARNHTHIDTFTARFEQNLFDESKMARDTAKHLGTNHHEVRLKQEDQFAMIDQLLNSALDEPFGDASALPSLFVSKAIKTHATVALSGDGADELFGGYRKYQGELAVRAWQRLPRSLRHSFKTIIDALPHSHANKLTDKFRQLHRFIHGAEHDDYHRHAAWMEVAASAHDIQQMLDKNKHVDLANMLRRIDTPNGMDKLSLTLLRDMHTVLISDMLVKIDRTSMHAGVEVRSPFLDHHVAEMAMAIDGKHKIAWRHGKKILRDMFKNDLPKTVFKAPKRGFEMPLNHWLCGPFQSRLKSALSADFLTYNRLNPNFGKVLEAGIRKGLLPHAEVGWTLISIYHWQKQRGFL